MAQIRSHPCVPPFAFSREIIRETPQTYYTARVSFDEALRPETAVKENFTVLRPDTGDELAITDAVYIPGSMEMRLMLEPAGLSDTACTVLTSDSLRYLGNTKPASEMTGTIQRDLHCDMFSVSVQRISLYQDGVRTLIPKPSSPLTVVARVINTSGCKKVKTVLLFLNDNSANPVLQREIELAAGAEADVSFELPDGLAEQDIINAVVV